MSQTVAYIQKHLRTELDVKIVEHGAKADMPTRLSLMIYGEHNGLAVLTLTQNPSWFVADVKTNDYAAVEWPKHLFPPSDEGALELVKTILESIPKAERVA
ncbi:hypothetical protein D3C80_680090 [compost metagenome]